MIQENARPPLVNYTRMAVEDRNASLEKGRYTAVDVDFAIITQPGSKDRIERKVDEWFAMLEREVVNGRFPEEWLDKLKRGYDAWKNNQELPEEGTPVANWPVLSPAQVTNLKRIGLLTVEAVAAANEQAINAYGMGGRELKSLAAKFLTTADKDKSAVAMQALEAENASLKERLASLEKQLATLASKVDVPTAPPPTAPIPLAKKA